MKEKLTSCIKKMQQKLKGSILAYSLIILAMMFTIVGSMSVVTVLEKNSASTSQSSAQSFQIADSAVQIAIKDIESNRDGILSDIFTSAKGRECKKLNSRASVSGSIGANMNYELVFMDENGAAISDCDIAVSNIRSIKSIGSYNNTTARAVEVAVAATPGFPTPGCYVAGGARDDNGCAAAGPAEAFSVLTNHWGTDTCAPNFTPQYHQFHDQNGANSCMWFCCQGF